MKKILVMGLPGSGKTYLANTLAPLLNAVHFNADAVRANINKDLGFSVDDRIEQARRMGWLCDKVTATGNYAIADFVCPTAATRAAFGKAYTIWMDTGKPTAYEDTKALFERPEHYNYRACTQDAGFHSKAILLHLKISQQTFNWRAPTALFVGRYQPFHDGHKALVVEGIERVGQSCIAVRDTWGVDEKNPYGFDAVKARIENMMSDYVGKFVVVQIPNITSIFYGRDVGYSIERIDLPEAMQAISATKIRESIHTS